MENQNSNTNNIKACFDNLPEKIKFELQKARFNISIAVAWFTDSILLNSLAEKAERGLLVDLILSAKELENQSDSFFDPLLNAGGNIYKTGAADFSEGGIMHNKFCVIDYETVITGSFNWTRQGGRNDENILIVKNKKIASQYLDKFFELRDQSNLLNNISNDIEISLSVSSNIIEQGSVVNLSWKVINALKIEISDLNNVSEEGNQDIVINNDTFIRLTAENAEIKKEKCVFIRAITEPEVIFTVSDHFTVKGQALRLSWKVRHAEHIEIDNGVGEIPCEGSCVVIPQKDMAYTITATNVTKIVTKVICINVYPVPVLDRIFVPMPVQLKFESVFVKQNIVVPFDINFSPILTETVFNIPKIAGLKSELIAIAETVKTASLDDFHTKQLNKTLYQCSSELIQDLQDKMKRIFKINQQPKK